MNLKTIAGFLLLSVLAFACDDIRKTGQVPAFSPITGQHDYYSAGGANSRIATRKTQGQRAASLWHSGPTSLLGDRRAGGMGDLLTVVIEINDKAEISNSTSQNRKGSEKLAVPQLFGIPQRIDEALPKGASSADAVNLSSTSSASGDGSVRRNEKLTLRVAATVTRVLPNGHLEIQGSQEVRVNFELRELLVSGYVRPEDISRKNEITYDKIASARISYGGRGQISQVQQPRKGKQVLDIILPF